MGEVQTRSTGAVIPFPHPSSRPAHRASRADQCTGEILLFTGVRYERQPEPSPEPSRPLSSDGRPGRRRRS